MSFQGERILVIQEQVPPFRMFSIDIFVQSRNSDGATLAVEVFEKLGYTAWTEGGPRPEE